MTIRARLTCWYAGVLTLCLLVISWGTYRELVEQLRQDRNERPGQHALEEAGELVFQVGVPALVLGLIGGWWLTRRALAPVAALTEAAERVNERNLGGQLPRSGNGDELDRLTEVLNAMTARLNDSFSRVREFTLHASHELKTPLTVLSAEVETELGNEQLTAAQRERCASQLQELRRLAQIVDSLTLLAKADAGMIRLALVPVRLDELARDSAADVQILAHAAGIQVEFTTCEAATVRGDANRLRQMLLNLADNAVKYNVPHGRIIMALRRAEGGAELTMANTGPGIPPESLARVFDRFFRCDPAHGNEVEGCGLGLSIVQWIVAAHQGAIQIASDPVKWTTVTVRLPLVEEPAGRA